MKVAIDSGPLSSGHSVRGIGTYTRMLAKSMGIIPVDCASVDLSDYDIVHLTAFKPYVSSIPFNKNYDTKFVLTIYDLIPLIYPTHYPSGIKGRLNFLLNTSLIKKNIDSIITISETSKKDICRFLNIHPERVTVTYLGPSFKVDNIKEKKTLSVVKNKYSLPDRFVLYVGDINFNKNIPNLIKACSKVPVELVIVGKQASEIENMDLNHPELSHLKDIDWSYVKRLGYVSESDLVDIYKLALAYVQPSFYEGFGLPVLDAFQMKIPVVAAKNQALVEIAEGCALFADPYNYLDIASKIEMSLDSRIFTPLIKSASERALKFSWESTARETYNVYKKTLGYTTD